MCWFAEQGFPRPSAWLPSYNALCDRYRKRIVAQTFGGRAFFANSRWKLTRRIRVKGKLRRRPEEIYRNALSYPSLVRQILADPDRFVRELNRIFAPYQDASGVITFEALSWGIEYRCQPATLVVWSRHSTDRIKREIRSGLFVRLYSP